MIKHYSFEFGFSMDHVPYRVQAGGNDMEELLTDATYNVDCPDPKEYLSIDNLPSHQYDWIQEKLASEIADADEAEWEHHREKLADAKRKGEW